MYDTALQSVLPQSYTSNRPRDDFNHRWPAYRDVTWPGRPAKEAVVEKIFDSRRIYSVSRYLFTPGRLYTFLIEGENEPPAPTDSAAFFNSFVVGRTGENDESEGEGEPLLLQPPPRRIGG